MSDPLPSVDEFLRLAHLFAQTSWPGSHPVEVRIVMIDGSVKPLAMLGVHAAGVPQPHPRQRMYEANSTQNRMTIEAPAVEAQEHPTPPSSSEESQEWGEAPEERGRGPMVARCTLEILTTLRDVGKPMTKTTLLEEMERRGYRWSERTVCYYLKKLMEDGTVENPDKAKPRGYRLSEWETTSD